MKIYSDIYEYTKELSGRERERRIEFIADAIGRSTATIYNKLRNKSFDKAQQIVLFEQLNGYLGSEEEINTFFTEKDLIELSKV